MTDSSGLNSAVRAELADCSSRLSFDEQALIGFRHRHGADELTAASEIQYLVGQAAARGYCVATDGGCWVVGLLGYEAVVSVVTETVLAYRSLGRRLPSQMLPLGQRTSRDVISSAAWQTPASSRSRCR
jgi:hypothetical protein